MARSAPSSLKAKRGQLSEAQIAVNDFHTGCLAYLADPFSDTGALFRFDALAVSKNLIDVFFFLSFSSLSAANSILVDRLVGARVGQMKQKPPTDGSPRRMWDQRCDRGPGRWVKIELCFASREALWGDFPR